MLNFLQGGLSTNFFCHAKFKGQKVFGIFSFTEHSELRICQGKGGSGYHLFLVMLNLRSKIFWNFSFIEYSGL